MNRRSPITVFAVLLVAWLFIPAKVHALPRLPDPRQATEAVPAQNLVTTTKVGDLVAPATGPMSWSSDLLCSAASTVDGLIREHVTDALPDLTAPFCVPDLPRFSFYTQWVSPDGETVARTHPAVVGVPAPLIVDDFPVPDFVATLSADDLTGLTLAVERLPGFTEDYPVSIEAVISDRTADLFGRRHLAFGYDARHDRAPDDFHLTASATSVLGTSYGFEFIQDGRGEEIAITAGRFDGSADDRTDADGLRVDYGASPDTAKLQAGLGDDLHVALTTDRPGPAQITGTIASGTGRDDVAIELEDLPSSLEIRLDAENAKVTSTASAPLDRVAASLTRSEPVFGTADNLELELNEVPTELTIQIPPGGTAATIETSAVLGQLRLAAHDGNGGLPDASLDDPDLHDLLAFRDVGDEFSVAVRLTALESLSISLDPVDISLEQDETRTRPIDIDATFTSGGRALEVEGLLDRPGATTSMSVQSSDDEPIRVVFDNSHPMQHFALHSQPVQWASPGSLLDTEHIGVEIDQVPTQLLVQVPPEGPLATIEANDYIGQLRLAAHDGSGAFPPPTLDTPGVSDLLGFRDVGDQFSVAVRLTAVKSLSISLDPVNISLEQDAAWTRAIALEAAFEAGGDVLDVEGLLNKPGAWTSMSVELSDDEPVRISFDNSHNMQRFELRGRGLGSVEEAELAFDNVSRRMTICMDPGPACQRPNPHGVQRYPTVASVDLDDHGTHGSGSGPAFRTTLNAQIAFDAADPITITDLRFRNLAFDFGEGPSHSSNCGTIPRVHLFFDSRSHPFVINSIKLPPAIQDFRIGTDGNPARAANRIARLNGWATGPFGCLGGLSTSSAGAMSCGGQQVLHVRTSVGTINLLNFLGNQLVPLCGGSVPNPQPW